MLSTLETMNLIKIEEGKTRRENLNTITKDGIFLLKIMK
jgi:hypothetical protein